ncbi:MAG: RDD family protein [Chloroflexi bacterium]|nr:RDD family protein [Chloroflexota bacterium]
MTQPGPGQGQQPPPSWQQSPTPPTPPPPASWQQAPQQPAPPVAPPPAQPPSWTANLTSQAPTPGPAGFVYGDIPNRAIAYIIDFVVLFIIGVVISAITLALFGNNIQLSNGTTTLQEQSMMSVLAYQAVWYIIVAAYFWYSWTHSRATVGMKLLGMQIGHEVDGRTISTDQAVVRIVAMFGPGLVAGIISAFALDLSFIANLVAFIWFLALLITTAQSPTKQGLHDRYAHTMVVKATRRAA